MKILGCDYDGTLFFNKDLKQSDVQAIHKFRNQGHKFGIVTGRPLSWLLGELKHYQIPFDFLVLTNGGLAVDQDLNSIYRLDIEPKTALQVIDWFQDHQYHFSISDGDGYYHSDQGESLEEYFRKPYGEKIYDLDHFSTGEAVSTIVLIAKEVSIMKRLQSKFHREVSFHINQDTLDMSAPLASKEYGMHQMSKFFSSDQVYVIGDNYNDVKMIEEFYGFAMKNGVQAAKDVAKEIVSSVEQAIESILNI